MDKQNLLIIGIVVAFIFILGILVLKNKNEVTKPAEEVKGLEVSKEPKVENTIKKPDMQIDKTKSYEAVLKTEKGDIKIKLNASQTSVTVNNFVYLSKKDFYDNTIFHRVINGFMIQGGDPLGNGTGGPGYKFDDEVFEGEYSRGVVAMANSGPNTNGCQFFIMHQTYPLPKNYVIFGEVIEGIEVVDDIATAEVTVSSMGEKSKPVSPVKILDVEIIEK